MKYGTNSGLIMLKKENGIIIDSTSNYLKKIVKTSDDDLTWKILLYLRKPKDITNISSHLNLEVSEVKQIIKVLLEKNLIVENPLTDKDKFFRVDRFINSLPNITYSEYRKKISQVKIMILGVGTAGSYTIEFLSKLGFNNFIIIDNDTVERKNIVSQNYFESDIGLLKTDVLKRRYSDCKIISINKKIKDYSEINKLLNKYHPQYLLSNADDADLVIDILGNVFFDHKELKILESGYNVSEVQFELIDKSNWKFFKEKFIEMRDYFMMDTEFNGIVDNSGMIFQAFISSFFSSKFIFDDITKLANPNWGRFNLLEDKYFFDDRFYWSDFQKYLIRYREDNSEETFNEDSNLKNEEFDDGVKLFLASKSNEDAFQFLRSLDVPKLKYSEGLSLEKIKDDLIDYAEHEFNSKIIDVKNIIDRNIVIIANNSNSQNRNYSESINSFENRIYIGSHGTDIIVNYLHETFHTLYFNLSNDSYKHEEFVLKNMLKFCLFLKNERKEYFKYLSSLIISYIQGYYLDDYLIVNKEKYELLGTSLNFYKSLDYSSMKICNKEEFNSYIEKKTKNKPKFYYLKYTYPVENNLQILKKITSELR